MRFAIPRMLTALAASALTLYATQAQAQAPAAPAATSGAAYAGPRFPGGPDSLAAVLRRATRGASPALTGQVVLYLELGADGKVSKAELLSPPARTPAARLAAQSDVQATAARLVRQLPAWELAATKTDDKLSSRVALPLTFGPPAAGPAPLAYADEEPLFRLPIPVRSGGGPAPSLVAYIQRQVRYPAQALRNREQGVVYAYFEVSETGAIEQPRIVGTAGQTLDDEVLRILPQLPAASQPARYQGRPARVFYVLPITFKIL